MSEKMEEQFQEIIDSMTEEQKAKAAACETPEELAALVAKEGIELSDEMLDAVAGGKFPWKKIFKIGSKIAKQLQNGNLV